MLKIGLSVGLVLSLVTSSGLLAPSSSTAWAAGTQTSAVLSFSTSAQTVAVNSPENRLALWAEVSDPTGISSVLMMCGIFSVWTIWPINSEFARQSLYVNGTPSSMKGPTAGFIYGDPRNFKISAGFDPIADSYPYSCEWSIQIISRQGVTSLTQTGISTTLTDSTKPEATTWPLVVKPNYSKKQLVSFAKKRFSNCSALRKYFPYGLAANADAAWDTHTFQAEEPFVSKSGYLLNRKLDKDRDNVACELFQ